MSSSENQTQINSQIRITDVLNTVDNKEIINEIISGLTCTRKYIYSKYFYDPSGSHLFEEITHLPEYYPTRIEKTILEGIASKLVNGLRNFDLIELGSGDCSKISILISAFGGDREHIRYIPVDVSKSAIIKSANILSQQFPEISIHGVVADFLSHLDLIQRKSQRLICFFGSTLGNLTQKQAVRFLLRLHRIMQPGDGLLVGLDMVKDKRIIEAAYNDSKQITAAFNRNILNVVNRHISSDFDPDDFEHLSFYNEDFQRIEMHLKAKKYIEVNSPYLPGKISFRKGETIHTENSKKYTETHILKFVRATGLKIRDIYRDRDNWFNLVHFE